MTWEGLSPPYSTIVVDPPWAYPGGVSAGGTPNKPVKSFALPYSGMDLDELRSLDIPSLAASDAWLFLWATNRYVVGAIGLLRHWGFKYRQTLVWVKPGHSPFGGTFAANGGEFLFGASRGNPPLVARGSGGSFITATRPGAGKHSTKPAAFMDLIEATCPPPYVELFARQPRLGWDSWGHGYEMSTHDTAPSRELGAAERGAGTPQKAG